MELKRIEPLGGSWIAKQIIERSKDTNIIYYTDDVIMNTQAVKQLAEYLENSISKDKIKEKIEELDKKIKDEYFTHDMYEGTNKVELWWSFQHKKAILEELLKGE